MSAKLPSKRELEKLGQAAGASPARTVRKPAASPDASKNTRSAKPVESPKSPAPQPQTAAAAAPAQQRDHEPPAAAIAPAPATTPSSAAAPSPAVATAPAFYVEAPSQEAV